MDIITAALAASMSGGGGGGTGTDDYNELSNKPKINGVMLAGSKSLEDIGAAAASETYTETEVDALLAEKADADDVYTKQQVDTELAKKVDKVTGKGLSTNDFTDAEKAKLAGAAPQATTYTKEQVDAALAGKVDKVDGKGLSTEDFTAAEKSKLSGIATGAEVNVQANWSQTSISADDFIKNKPALGAAASKDVDSTPTASSTNLVTSGGVATALAAKLNTADVDAALSSTSTNPVQNKVVQAPIARLVDAGAKNLLKNERNSGSTVTSQGAIWTFSQGTMEATISGTVGTTWSDVSILFDAIDLSDKDYVVVVQSDVQNAFVYLSGNTLTGGNIPTNGQYYPGVYRYRGTIAANARFTARTGTFDNNFLRIMICTTEDYTISTEFVQYAPSSRELYEMILALQNAQNGG